MAHTPVLVSSDPLDQVNRKESSVKIIPVAFSLSSFSFSFSFFVVRITTNGENWKSFLSRNKLGCKSKPKFFRINFRTWSELLVVAVGEFVREICPKLSLSFSLLFPSLN